MLNMDAGDVPTLISEPPMPAVEQPVQNIWDKEESEAEPVMRMELSTEENSVEIEMHYLSSPSLPRPASQVPRQK